MNRPALGISLWAGLAALLAVHAEAGDFNGDGFDDIAIGAPHESVGAVADAGCVNVIYGSPTGLQASISRGAIIAAQLWHQNIPGIAESAESGDLFGSAIATGDLNGDGYDDLAVGAPGESVGGTAGAGCVHIIYGSATGLTPDLDKLLTSAAALVPVNASAGFGRSLAILRLSDDPYDGIAICGTDIGSRHPVHIDFAACVTEGHLPQYFDSESFGDPAQHKDCFGERIVVADWNCDGYDDAAFGASFRAEYENYSTPGGAVYLAYGSPYGLAPSQEWPVIYENMLPASDGSETGDRFGFSMGCGDVNGDGCDDLIIGTPFEDIGSLVDAGAMHCIYGTPGVGLRPDGSTWIYQDIVAEHRSEEGDLFAYALIAGSVAQGPDFILASSPGEEWQGGPNNAGQVMILQYPFGNPIQPLKIWNQDTPGVLDVAEAGDHYGSAVTVGDFNGDQFLDLALAAFLEDISTSVDAGMVHVTLGDNTVMTFEGDQVWHQNSGGVPEAAQPGDCLGWSIH